MSAADPANCLGMFREGVRYALESSLAAGSDSVTVVVQVVCRLSASSFVASSKVLGTHVMVRLSSDQAPASGCASLFQFSLLRDEDVVCLHQEEHSAWVPHVPLRPEHWEHVRETCTGIGALGDGALSVGLDIVARNELQPTTCRLLESLGRSGVVQGDIGDQAVVRAM